MTEYRSKSYADGRNNNNNDEYQLEKSYSYAGPRRPDYMGLGQGPAQIEYEVGPPKLNNKLGSTKNWTVLSDPEMKRKKRVASYKAYSVEGKVKGGFKKGFKWFKDRYHLVLHGWKS